jgi:hypothetical protein
MPRAGCELTTLLLEWTKTLHVVDRSAAVKDV